MGEVWRAKDERLDRYVALKLLPSQLADNPDRRMRLLREAKAAAAIPHANVVTLFDIVSEDGRDVLVMELVEGTTLSEHLREHGPMEIDEALAALLGIAEALAAAHERDILHRDIKAANIMVEPGGGVKVLDFGLAKLRQSEEPGAGATGARPRRVPADERESVALDATMPSVSASIKLPDEAEPEAEPEQSIELQRTMPSDLPSPVDAVDALDALATQAGSLMGTPLYMAPEQLAGAPTDERSEVFSVGIIAYEILAGKPPYSATTLEKLFVQIETLEPPALADTVPAPLRAIVTRALAKDPEARFQSMQGLGDALAALQTSRAAPMRRRRWTWAAAAGIVAALIATVIVFVLTRPKPRAAQRPGDVYVARALEEYDVFFNAKSLSSLRAAIKHDPDHPRAFAYVVLFGQAKKAEHNRAVAEAKRLLPKLPADAKMDRALLGAAIAMHDLGPSKARKALLAAGAESGHELGFWSAELAYRARDYETADREFRALLADNAPLFRGRIYDHYSSVLLYFDKPAEAVAVGKMYRDQFPGEADAVGVYATTLAAAGRFDEALARAKEALELHEGEDTLAGLAKVHAWRGELKKARALYERSMHRAHDARRPIRRAALGLLRLMDGDRKGAGEAVAPCLPEGADAEIPTRAACLWAAGMVWPERIPEIVKLLQTLAATGTETHPPYGFPTNLARLLEARALFDGGGCIEPTDGKVPDTAATAQIRRLMDGARDFYASYHVPYFDSWRVCFAAALKRVTGDPRGGAAIVEAVTGKTRGRVLLLLELARARARFDRDGVATVLAKLRDDLPTLDQSSVLRRRAEAHRAGLKAPK